MQILDQNPDASLEKEDNREAIKRARNGDDEALNLLFLVHQDDVRRFVSLRVRNREDAEDISQEVLMRGCLKLNTFQGRSTLRTWLLAIAKRAVSDFYRENRCRRQTVPTDEDAAETCLCCDFVREVCDVRQHMEDCLRCILRTLAIEQQVAVFLAAIIGFSDKETALILGKNFGALKHLLHNARATMDLASGGTCALVRKTGDGSECAACNGSCQWKVPLPGNLRKLGAGNGDQKPGNGALLSLRADLLRNIESVIHCDSTAAGLALLDPKTT